ncbi:hypothetical protein QJQ45_018725 [Haematococcus lacustris]|nr:hypothetical protein QJQ45_018725 [Haematococcus lacustris]
MFGVAAPKANYNPNSDVEVAVPADLDGISSVRWSPTANFLAASSWNHSVYVWDIQPTGQTVPKAQNKDHTQPVLCTAWNQDGSQLFTGGCDKSVRLWNLATNQSQQVAQHDAPVAHCFHVPSMNMLVTGSWDKTMKFWDCRTPTAAHSQTLPERIYAMDVNYPLAVLGTADRNLIIYDLTKPQAAFKTLQSPLKWQTRCVACFPDKQGYLVGSIEGRVAVQHVDDAVATTKNFTFKCHRDGNDIYAVNSIQFHPAYGTFVTAGSDGTYNFWDKDSKQRLKAMAKCTYPNGPAPIPCSSFNKDGSLYAYAVSYDWSRGYSDYQPQQMKNTILLHQVKEDEVKAKPKAATSVAGRNTDKPSRGNLAVALMLVAKGATGRAAALLTFTLTGATRTIASSSLAGSSDNVDFGFKDVPRDQKANLVAQVFSSVASSYDVMNDLMSAGLHRVWKDQLVQSLQPFPGMRHLDVAGGTGDVAFRVLRAIRKAEALDGSHAAGTQPSAPQRPPAPPHAPNCEGYNGSQQLGDRAVMPIQSPIPAAAGEHRRAPASQFPDLPGVAHAVPLSGVPGAAAATSQGPQPTPLGAPPKASHAAKLPASWTPGSVTVCDINPEMLAEGRKKAAAAQDLAGDTGLVFELGNAEALDQFPDASFDAYTIAFGIRNVTDRPAALREAYRLLKPGGRFLCLEFSHVSQPVLRQAYDAYSFAVIPRIGGLVAGDAASYQYLVESIRQFPDQDSFADMIEDAGFKAVGYTNIMGGVVALHTGYKLPN